MKGCLYWAVLNTNLRGYEGVMRSTGCFVGSSCRQWMVMETTWIMGTNWGCYSNKGGDQ